MDGRSCRRSEKAAYGEVGADDTMARRLRSKGIALQGLPDGARRSAREVACHESVGRDFPFRDELKSIVDLFFKRCRGAFHCSKSRVQSSKFKVQSSE